MVQAIDLAHERRRRMALRVVAENKDRAERSGKAMADAAAIMAQTQVDALSATSRLVACFYRAWGIL